MKANGADGTRAERFGFGQGLRPFQHLIGDNVPGH